MRLPATLLAVAACAALPAWADKRIDDAVAKADAQLARGKVEEAVKTLQKASAQAPRDPEPPSWSVGFGDCSEDFGSLLDSCPQPPRAIGTSAIKADAKNIRTLGAKRIVHP